MKTALDYTEFISSLSDNELRVLIFRDFGYSMMEIAGFIGITRQNVWNNCERIKRKALSA